MLQENEIVCSAHPVKYHGLDHEDGYITLEQHRTRRRIPDGYHFEDTGTHIYVSPYYSHLFQHKLKVRKFILNKETKEWRDYSEVIIERHIPEKHEPVKDNVIKELLK